MSNPTTAPQRLYDGYITALQAAIQTALRTTLRTALPSPIQIALQNGSTIAYTIVRTNSSLTAQGEPCTELFPETVTCVYYAYTTTRTQPPRTQPPRTQPPRMQPLLPLLLYRFPY